MSRFTAFVAALAVANAMPFPHSISEIREAAMQAINRRGAEPWYTSPLSNQLPGCNADKGWETSASTPISKFAVPGAGSLYGTLLGSDCNSKDCHTEYWIVGTRNSFRPWTQVGNDENEGNGTTLTQTQAAMVSNCVENTITVSDAIAVEADATFLGSGGKVTNTITVTASKSDTKCSQNTTTVACAWTTAGCHRHLIAPKQVTYYGMMARRCKAQQTVGNWALTPKCPDGKYTSAIVDFDFSLGLVNGAFDNCNAPCGEDYSQTPLPAPDTSMVFVGSPKPVAPGITHGWCGVHVVQHQKANPVGLNNYHYDVTVKDGGQNIVGSVTNMDLANGKTGSIKTLLPTPFTLTSGNIDKDAVYMGYNGASWGSADQGHHCNFGSYDSGSRSGDCGFTC